MASWITTGKWDAQKSNFLIIMYRSKRTIVERENIGDNYSSQMAYHYDIYNIGVNCIDDQI